MLGLPLVAAPVTGRVTDGLRGLAGARVYPDRPVTVRPQVLPPLAVTDAQGWFTLDLAPGDTAVAVERPGRQRDLVPVAGLNRPVVLRRAPAWRREPVLVVRLDYPDRPPLRTDGELRVDDPRTAGGWDVMDAGQFRGWQRRHPDTPPWQEDTATSPSAPMGWVRAELWYRGAFRATVRTLRVRRRWTGWLDPLARAPGAHPQRLLVPDPRWPRRFWEFNVRLPLGFDQGRVGGRWGPGHQGLVVAQVDPGRLTLGRPRGPVRVLDAHPDTPEPPQPRYPGGRWQLDDAAYNLGPGEVPAGADGPLSWEVLAVDASGRMRVRVAIRP